MAARAQGARVLRRRARLQLRDGRARAHAGRRRRPAGAQRVADGLQGGLGHGAGRGLGVVLQCTAVSIFSDHFYSDQVNLGCPSPNVFLIPNRVIHVY